MSELPEGYKKGIPRVSDIVSFMYPFEGEGKDRYLQWIYSKRALMFKPCNWSINKFRELNKFDSKKEGLIINGKKVNLEFIKYIEKEYIDEACTIGTYIHQHMEDYCNNVDSEVRHICPIIDDTINNGLDYIDVVKEKYPASDGREYTAEPILRDKDNRFQGSSDLVLINNKTNKVVVIDWKSYGISKAKFRLPNKYKKPYDKIKKGRVQFSLYAETYRQKGYDIEDIILVYLHRDGAYPYKLELYTTEELDKILKDFKNHKELKRDKREDLLPKDKSMTVEELQELESFDLPMEIEILEPTKQFGNIKCRLNLETIDNGRTQKENVDQLCKKVLYIANQMK